MINRFAICRKFVINKKILSVVFLFKFLIILIFVRFDIAHDLSRFGISIRLMISEKATRRRKTLIGLNLLSNFHRSTEVDVNSVSLQSISVFNTIHSADLSVIFPFKVICFYKSNRKKRDVSLLLLLFLLPRLIKC